jgi:PE-PPE domain
MVATAGAGFLGFSAALNPGHARADDPAEDIGLVMGGSGLPIPGTAYVGAADQLYINAIYPDTTYPAPYAIGLSTPEQLYPLTGVHQLPLNYPPAADGFPSTSTSVGLGMADLENAITTNVNDNDATTVFGYSQSSTLSSYVMQQLDPHGTPQTGALDPKFLLIGDPSNPNGGLLSRFDGFTLSNGHVVTDPLNLPALGVSFDSVTPADDYVTSMYSLEYDGFTDFPKYPINFLSDLNAFLGIATIHGTYLNGGVDGSGPTAAEIAAATENPLAGSMALDTTNGLTNYYMINETAPLVALLPKPLQELLGPDLTYLINLGYGDGTLGYSVDATSPANEFTPFGLFPDVSVKDVFTSLIADTKEGFQNLIGGTDPYEAASLGSGSVGQSIAEAMASVHSALAADPSASLTDLINALTSATSAAYSALLPTADIINSLVTSMPAYDVSLFTEALSNGGGLLDALGLPLAADTALVTLAGGFEVEVLQNTISEIASAFTGAL